MGEQETVQEHGQAVEERVEPAGTERLLRVDELLLLVNVLYMQGQGEAPRIADYAGRPLGELPLTGGTEGLCMDEEERKRLAAAIGGNLLLQSLRIIDVCHQPADGAGACVCFQNEASGERIVAFRGTTREEWRDNFLGAAATEAADGVSTDWQLHARAWYRSLPPADGYVTVTGHSKGGNKAKYLAILEDSVDRCVSFDGQGFSDEFFVWYRARIAMRQKIIENHNADYDYVGLLLEDVGRSVYYEGCEPGRGGFLTNHCPNAFFHWEEDGSYELRQAKQAEELQELDRFLSAYLRSLPKKKKIDAAEWLGAFAQKKADSASKEACIRQLLDIRYLESVMRFAAFVAGYRREEPESFGTLGALLARCGLEELKELLLPA